MKQLRGRRMTGQCKSHVHLKLERKQSEAAEKMFQAVVGFCFCFDSNVRIEQVPLLSLPSVLNCLFPPFASLALCLSVCLSVCLSLSLSLSLSLCVSLLLAPLLSLPLITLSVCLSVSALPVSPCSCLCFCLFLSLP